ncbi:MAG: iron ABC transporter permease [Alphaproteobacteria bacterium]|nr:MAG: iron ABC transporter permease [Alphaproteobacteria bacterium]
MSTATATEIMRVAAGRQRRAVAVLWGFGGLLALAFLLSVGWGAVPISPGQVLAIVADALGFELPWDFGHREEAVLLAIRLPRACLGMLAGAALAVSGASLQGLFRNPLADPALIGVSTGAALTAVGVIVLGAGLATSISSTIAPFLLPIAAFTGGLLTTLLVYRIANRDGRTDVATMLLAGVALNAIASAGIGLLVFISTDQQLRDLNFWLLGSLGGITWATMLPAIPFIASAIVALPLFARHLNALLLGEKEALHLGFHVERTKRFIVILAALATGASVALTGVIGFVGLVVPHLVRLTIGPDHRILLPASILLGAGLMLVADLAARTVVLPAELPIGILTSCVGGPFFLWLLLRRRSLGGW